MVPLQCPGDLIFHFHDSWREGHFRVVWLSRLGIYFMLFPSQAPYHPNLSGIPWNNLQTSSPKWWPPKRKNSRKSLKKTGILKKKLQKWWTWVGAHLLRKPHMLWPHMLFIGLRWCGPTSISSSSSWAFARGEWGIKDTWLGGWTNPSFLENMSQIGFIFPKYL